MSATAVVTGSPWEQRRRRAQMLIERLPYAEELLRFYVGVLEIQERVNHDSVASPWFSAMSSNPDGSPRIDLGRLPLSDMLPMFRDFVEAIAPVATCVLQATAASVRGAGDHETVCLLRDFVSGTDQSQLARTLECELPQLEFFPRAFLQPVAEAIALHAATPIGDWRSSRCPRCGGAPQVAVLHDAPDAKGQRLLVCCLCASTWPSVRSRCSGCGEQNPGKLLYHVADGAEHIRIEECKSCRCYIKSVDLREDGRAVPLVDDIAFMALDLWAHEQELSRIHPNLLGF